MLMLLLFFVGTILVMLPLDVCGDVAVDWYMLCLVSLLLLLLTLMYVDVVDV